MSINDNVFSTLFLQIGFNWISRFRPADFEPERLAEWKRGLERENRGRFRQLIVEPNLIPLPDFIEKFRQVVRDYPIVVGHSPFGDLERLGVRARDEKNITGRHLHDR